MRPGFGSLRIKTWLASGLFSRPWPWRLLAPLFVWILLEANLGLSSLRSLLPRPVERFWKPIQGNSTPSLWCGIGFDAPRDPWEGFVEIYFFFAAFGMRYHPQNPEVVPEQPYVHQNRFFIESFWFLVPMFFKGSKIRFLV